MRLSPFETFIWISFRHTLAKPIHKLCHSKSPESWLWWWLIKETINQRFNLKSETRNSDKIFFVFQLFTDKCRQVLECQAFVLRRFHFTFYHFHKNANQWKILTTDNYFHNTDRNGEVAQWDAASEHQIERTHQLISMLILYSRRFYYELISHALNSTTSPLLQSKRAQNPHAYLYLYFSCDGYTWIQSNRRKNTVIIWHMICTQSIVLKTHNGINHLEIRRSIENIAK